MVKIEYTRMNWAVLLNITAVQVRRDIMFIGYSSTQRKGYDIKDLTEVISKIIDNKEALNVAVVGYGNLGKAIATYFWAIVQNLILLLLLISTQRKLVKQLTIFPAIQWTA
jgi:NADH/NAD ratio-sensing transcriptional regulator Rex